MTGRRVTAGADVLKCATVSLAQLEYFVAVAEEGHLTRAASRLHISQPPLTRAVHRLEAELGVPLFERTAKGMVLLPAGQRLLGRAREILALVEQTRQEAATAEETEQAARAFGARRSRRSVGILQ